MENIEFKERFIDEKTGIEYIRKGDYYIPNLVMPPRKNIRNIFPSSSTHLFCIDIDNLSSNNAYSNLLSADKFL